MLSKITQFTIFIILLLLLLIIITRPKPAFGPQGLGRERGARIHFRWVHIGHFSKNGLIENTHTFCGKIQEVSLNVWRNTMDSKGQICEKIMFVSICGVGRTQTMASCNGSCSLGRMTPQPKQAQRQREKELIFRGSRYDFLEKELIFRKLE